MTERWRKRLGDLDKQNPTEDLFERAKGGPQLPDEPISRPSTSTRIVTGVAALVVFALAISVFAIPALRLEGGSSARGSVDIQLPLWPERTLDGMQQLQADAEDGKASWALDPEQVATRFGGTVAGLDPVYAHDEGSTGEPLFIGSSGVALPGSYEPLAPSTAASSPFRTFSLNQCAPDSEIRQTICDYSFPGPPSISLVLYQPFGSGVWAVLAVHSVYVELPTQPGETLENGSTISAGFRLPSDYHVELGYRIGDGSCDVNGSTSSSRSPGQAGPDGLISAGSALDVVFDVSSTAGCAEEEPGYAYAAVADSPIEGDGLESSLLGTGEHRLLGFAAVPITAVIPQVETTSGASLSTSTDPQLAWTKYSDALGWTIEVPESWVTKTIDGSDARVSYQGAAFGSAALEQAPGGPTTISPPVGEVMLMITHREGGPADTTDADSTFPLAYDDLSQEEGGLTGTFRGDGLPFDLVIRFGDPTDQQVEILRHMVGSISFKPWEFGDERNGWVALHDPSTDNAPDRAAHISWQQCDNTGCYVLAYGGDVPYGLGPIQTCGEGENMTADPTSSYSIVLECPSGSAQSWAVDGTPAPTNAPGDDVPLDHHPVIRAWDGTLLMNPSITIG